MHALSSISTNVVKISSRQSGSIQSKESNCIMQFLIRRKIRFLHSTHDSALKPRCAISR